MTNEFSGITGGEEWMEHAGEDDTQRFDTENEMLREELEALRRERDEWKASAVERGKTCLEYMNACRDIEAQLAIAVEALTRLAHGDYSRASHLASVTIAKLKEAGHE